MDLNLETAAVTVTGTSGWANPSIDSAKTLLIEPATTNAGLNPDAMTIEMVDAVLSLDTDTGLAEAAARAPRIVLGDILPGNFVQNPIEIAGTGGTYWVWAGYTLEDEDAQIQSSAVKSIWFRYVPGETSILVLAGTNGYWKAFSEDDIISILDAPPEEIGSGILTAGAQYNINASEGMPIYIRVDPSTGVTVDSTLTWTVLGYQPELTLEISPPYVQQTPTTMRVTVMGAPANAEVDFVINGTTMLTEDCDETGQIINASVPVPTLPVGTHVLRAVVDNATYDETLFTVLNPAPSRPTTQPADALPVSVPAALVKGVRKWVLQDAAPGGEIWIFPVNPSEMDSPHAAREVAIESTVAVDGQAILWEGAPRAHEWSFGGYTDSQAVHDALERFRNLRHRFWLIDHRNRAWSVSFTHIDWTPRRVPGKDWSFNYKVSAQIYAGPEVPQ